MNASTSPAAQTEQLCDPYALKIEVWPYPDLRAFAIDGYEIMWP
jgi:hypothetical protein